MPYLHESYHRGFDDEMRAVVARNLEGRGINLHPRTNLTEVLPVFAYIYYCIPAPYIYTCQKMPVSWIFLSLVLFYLIMVSPFISIFENDFQCSWSKQKMALKFVLTMAKKFWLMLYSLPLVIFEPLPLIHIRCVYVVFKLLSWQSCEKCRCKSMCSRWLQVGLLTQKG